MNYLKWTKKNKTLLNICVPFQIILWTTSIVFELFQLSILLDNNAHDFVPKHVNIEQLIPSKWKKSIC